jgi:hypothetical protein
MKTKTHFAFRVDIWDDIGDSIVEHVAGVDDFEVAEATYRAAVARWPGAHHPAAGRACCAGSRWLGSSLRSLAVGSIGDSGTANDLETRTPPEVRPRGGVSGTLMTGGKEGQSAPLRETPARARGSQVVRGMLRPLCFLPDAPSIGRRRAVYRFCWEGTAR